MNMSSNRCHVVSVALSGSHSFSKTAESQIELIEGQGVAGDAHCGKTVKHRSRVAQDPTQLNLRQVHLIHQELFEELDPQGYRIAPGEMGENVTTVGVDLLSLPERTRLRLGESAVVELTGLRNPCHQIDNFRKGLLKAVLGRTESGELIRKSGVMAVVRHPGLVRPGDVISVELPEGEHQPLQAV